MIIPAILESSTAEVQRKVGLVKGLTQRVQIDVIDGVFADNPTVSPADMLNIDFAGLAVDIHLMTEEPVDFLEESARLIEKCGGIRVIGQIERMGKQTEFISLARELKLAVGLGLDLYTPVDAIDKKIAGSLDCVLLMAVKAGTQGINKLSPAVVEKIKEIKAGQPFAKSWPGQIIVDGGLNPETVNICRQAGAAQFAVGSWLWEHKDISLAIKELNKI